MKDPILFLIMISVLILWILYYVDNRRKIITKFRYILPAADDVMDEINDVIRANGIRVHDVVSINWLRNDEHTSEYEVEIWHKTSVPRRMIWESK